jgi:hypothetical protein
MVASIELGSLASKDVVFAISKVERQIEHSMATPSYPLRATPLSYPSFSAPPLRNPLLISRKEKGV